MNFINTYCKDCQQSQLYPVTSQFSFCIKYLREAKVLQYKLYFRLQAYLWQSAFICFQEDLLEYNKQQKLIETVMIDQLSRSVYFKSLKYFREINGQVFEAHDIHVLQEVYEVYVFHMYMLLVVYVFYTDKALILFIN